MMYSYCFLIPVKIDTPSQEFYVRRCLQSIRRLYSDTQVVLALAPGTAPLAIVDPHCLQVQNPYFSTLGCLSLFHDNKYAEYAYILHDSMVLTAILPEPVRDVSFVYTFHEPGMCEDVYGGNYKKILSHHQHYSMIRDQTTGCFGVSMGIHCSAIERLGVLPLLPKVTTKLDFCAMERIFAYLCESQGIAYDALCGTIFGETNPWVHPEFASMTLDELLDRNYRVCILKSLVGRTE